MLTYATPDQFKSIKQIGKSGVITVSQATTDQIQYYLSQATRYIDRVCRRQFFPSVETRDFSIPYRYQDLAVRRFRYADLILDEDLLESTYIDNNGEELTSDQYFLLEQNIFPKILVAIKRPYSWGGQTIDISLDRPDEPIIHITGLWGYFDFHYPQEAWLDTYQTITGGGIDAQQTFIPVTSVAGSSSWGDTAFPLTCLIRVEDELMEVTSLDNTMSANKLNVIRGVRGSTAVAHTTVGTKILRWRVIEDIQKLTLEIARVWRDSDPAAGGKLGISDISANVQSTLSADPMNILRMYTKAYVKRG